MQEQRLEFLSLCVDLRLEKLGLENLGLELVKICKILRSTLRNAILCIIIVDWL